MFEYSFKEYIVVFGFVGDCPYIIVYARIIIVFSNKYPLINISLQYIRGLYIYGRHLVVATCKPTSQARIISAYKHTVCCRTQREHSFKITYSSLYNTLSTEAISSELSDCPNTLFETREHLNDNELSQWHLSDAKQFPC